MPWPTVRDDEVFALIDREVERQNTTLQLIASENFTSPEVLRATGSVLTNKYSEGYPGKRYYGGNQVIDEVEDIARRRACELFGAEHANVQPHAGAARARAAAAPGGGAAARAPARRPPAAPRAAAGRPRARRRPGAAARAGRRRRSRPAGAAAGASAPRRPRGARRRSLPPLLG